MISYIKAKLKSKESGDGIPPYLTSTLVVSIETLDSFFQTLSLFLVNYSIFPLSHYYKP